MVAETGEVKSVISDTSKLLTKSNQDQINRYQGAKFSDLMSCMTGGQISFKDFSITGSYTNIGDSFTSTNIVGNNPPLDTNDSKSSYYVIGGKYQYNDLGTSVSYFNSDRKQNKMDAITFALDYKFAEGLKPYAEFTRFTMDGINPRDSSIKKQIGRVFIIGAKLSF